MSENELYKLMGNNIADYLKIAGKTRQELADYMGVSHVTISYWCNGQKMPRMDKIDKICRFLGIKRSDLMEDHSSMTDKEKQAHYINQETAEIAQKIFENDKLRLLFSAAQDASPSDLETVHTMLMALKKKEMHEDD